MSDLVLISREEAAELRGQYRQLDFEEEMLKRGLERVRNHKRAIAEKILLGGKSMTDQGRITPDNTNASQQINGATP